MILVVIALLWVALLAPVAIRRFRETRTEKSIESFHTEHEVLSRQAHSVNPAYRLSEFDVEQTEPEPRPSRLTVVHDDDTYRSLESRRSWDEWSEDYDYDRQEQPVRVSTNRYASAYSSVPRDVVIDERYEPPLRRRTMRAQRRLMLTTLVLAVLATTTLALVAGSSLLVDLAILTWVALATYGALALYAVSQGLLDESTLGLDRLRSRSTTRVATLYGRDDEVESEDDDGYGSPISALRAQAYDDYDEPAADGWSRSSSRFALG